MKFTLIHILFFLLAIPVQNEFAHDIHLSMAEVELNPDNSEFSIRIFSDDLLVALLQRFDLNEIPDDPNQSKQLISRYVSERFVLNQSDSIMPFETIAIEPGVDAFWCTFQVSDPKFDFTQPFQLSNTILFEIFNDQTNIVHFNYPTGKKVFTFDRKKESIEILL